jgi:hypothetical protein
MAEIIDVANALFKDRNKWKDITDEDKNKFFFIFNRYLAKKYTENSQLLNHKEIDKVSSFDLWYYFLLDKPYPKWFWSKDENKVKSKISDKEKVNLQNHLKCDTVDLDYLILNHEDFILEELKYLKNLEKNK